MRPEPAALDPGRLLVERPLYPPGYMKWAGSFDGKGTRTLGVTATLQIPSRVMPLPAEETPVRQQIWSHALATMLVGSRCWSVP